MGVALQGWGSNGSVGVLTYLGVDSGDAAHFRQRRHFDNLTMATAIRPDCYAVFKVRVLPNLTSCLLFSFFFQTTFGADSKRVIEFRTLDRCSGGDHGVGPAADAVAGQRANPLRDGDAERRLPHAGGIAVSCIFSNTIRPKNESIEIAKEE